MLCTSLSLIFFCCYSCSLFFLLVLCFDRSSNLHPQSILLAHTCKQLACLYFVIRLFLCCYLFLANQCRIPKVTVPLLSDLVGKGDRYFRVAVTFGWLKNVRFVRHQSFQTKRTRNIVKDSLYVLQLPTETKQTV